MGGKRRWDGRGGRKEEGRGGGREEEVEVIACGAPQISCPRLAAAEQMEHVEEIISGDTLSKLQ